MGNVFNLNKIAQSYKNMDTDDLVSKAKSLMSNPSNKEFSDIYQELANRAYSSKDRKLMSFLERMTTLFASQSTETEIANYEQEQAVSAQAIKNKGLDLLGKINIEAYKIVNENINKITSLDKTLEEECKLGFIERFLGKYHGGDDVPEGCKQNIGQFFLDRFANSELRKNIFNRYDFFGYNPSILRYYANIAYYQDSKYLKSINEDVHHYFNSHMGYAGLNEMDGQNRDKLGLKSFNFQLSDKDFHYAPTSEHRGMPLHARQVVVDEQGKKDFLIIKVLEHFYNSLKNREPIARCFVLNKFIQLVNYSVKSEEYKIDPNKICQSKETGINFLNRTAYHVNSEALSIMASKLEEVKKFQKSIGNLSTNFSGDAQVYMSAIHNGLSECTSKLDQWIDELTKWQNFQSEMYANKDNALNYINIIVNKLLNNTASGEGASNRLKSNGFAPVIYSSTDGIVTLKCVFKSTGKKVKSSYEYSVGDSWEHVPQVKELAPKEEVNIDSITIDVSENLAFNVPTDTFENIVKDPNKAVAELCEIVSSIPSAANISPKNLSNHTSYDPKLKNNNGYYALNEEEAYGIDSEEKLPEMVADIKDFLASNVDQIIKILEHLEKKSRIPLPPVPAVDEGTDVSKVEEIRRYPVQGVHSLEGLQKFYPHQGIVLHQIVVGLENEYRNSIAELNKDLGLTDDALECYESVGRLSILSKIKELESSLSQMDKNDPERENIRQYKEKLQLVNAKMNKIFRGDKAEKGDGLLATGWDSAGSSLEKIRGKPKDKDGRTYLYSFPDWLRQAIRVDNDEYAKNKNLGLSSSGVPVESIVSRDKIKEIITNYLEGLDPYRILDLGAMLKVVNNLGDTKSTPMCNLGINKNYAGAEIGKAVKRAVETKKLSEKDAESIALMFSSLTKGDGLAYVRAIGKEDLKWDPYFGVRSYNLGEIKALEANENYAFKKIAQSFDNTMSGYVNYSINDWTKFIARRIYLGG